MYYLKQILSWYGDYLNSLFNFHKREINITCFMLLFGVCTGYYDFLSLNADIERVYANLVSQFKEHQNVALFFKIFLQNSRATLIVICTGILFSFFPVITALLNGMIIGFVLSHIEKVSHLSSFQGFLLTIPHGIFEIPAFVLAISLGIKLGQWPLAEKKVLFVKQASTRALQCYLLLLLPLLFIAGIIETCTIGILHSQAP